MLSASRRLQQAALAASCALACAMFLPARLADAAAPTPYTIDGPVESSADPEGAYCSTPLRRSLQTNDVGIVFIQSCMGLRDRLPTTVRYREVAARPRRLDFYMGDDQPAVLGFGSAQEIAFLTTKHSGNRLPGDGLTLHRLSLKRQGGEHRSERMPIPFQAMMAEAVAGDGCWLARAAEYPPGLPGRNAFVLVDAAWRMKPALERAGSRTLFWNQAERGFVLVDESGIDATFSSLRCDGTSQPLPARLEDWLKRNHRRGDLYFSSRDASEIATSRSKVTGEPDRTDEILDLRDGQTMPVPGDRVHAFAADPERHSLALVRSRRVEIYLRGRLARTFPIDSGWSTQVAFVQGGSILIVLDNSKITTWAMESEDERT